MPKKLKVIMQKDSNNDTKVFKPDVDYYELNDGQYWPVTSLKKKYGCSSFHIYDKAKIHNIPKRKIMDVTLYKDMPEFFTKKPSGKRNVNGERSAEHLKKYRTAQFAELCATIRSLESRIDQLQIATNLILTHLTEPKND